MEPEILLQCLQESATGGTISQLNPIHTQAPHFTLNRGNTHVISSED